MYKSTMTQEEEWALEDLMADIQGADDDYDSFIEQCFQEMDDEKVIDKISYQINCQ